jgi:hypothetical protein
MGIALFTASGLFSPMQALIGWLMPRTPRSASLGHMDATCTRRGLAHDAAARPAPAATCAAAAIERSGATARRPLRVLRVVESNAAPAHAGRMLISGRMADVCAELDRLAAKEAAQQCA